MTKNCLYAAVLLVVFINYVKTEAINDLDPSGSLDHENMEFDDSVIENESNIESSFNDGINYAENCNCKKGYICESINGKPICKCPPGYVEKMNVILGNECLPCNCGKESNCTITISPFSSIKIKCICKEGYKAVDNFCKGPCTVNPCQNGGTCADENKSFKCFCPPGYTGKKCENKSNSNFALTSDCGPGYVKKDDWLCYRCDCKGDGTCRFDETGALTCDCGLGFAKKEDGLCYQCDCKGDGTCRFDETGALTCDCGPGFAKKEDGLCYHICTDNPCQNGGDCIIDEDSFKCNCRPPYLGNICEEDICTDNPCKNGGDCIIEEDSFKCKCRPPYLGKTCEEDKCDGIKCENGIVCEKGKCPCETKPGLSGERCEAVDGCVALKATCDAISKNCIYDPNTEVKATCDCGDDQKFDGTECKECHCGENSVSCRIDGRGNKLCFCNYGFDQRRGTDICSRTCQSNADCRNDGICDRDGPGYFCLCPEPFIGDRCELDVCNSLRFECRSKGAECVRQGTIGVCECPRGKKMSLFNYCEDVCTSETCVYGTCELTDYNFSQYVCNCYEGYYGSRCENALVIHYRPAITILVILASGIVLFSITSIVAGCWVKKLRKKIAENTKQTGQP